MSDALDSCFSEVRVRWSDTRSGQPLAYSANLLSPSGITAYWFISAWEKPHMQRGFGIDIPQTLDELCNPDRIGNLRRIRDVRRIMRGEGSESFHRKSTHSILCPAALGVDYYRRVLLHHIFLYQLSSS